MSNDSPLLILSIRIGIRTSRLNVTNAKPRYALFPPVQYTPADSASRWREPRPIFPIFLPYCSPQSVAHFCILQLTAYAKVVQGALIPETEETQASVVEPRGRASERGEGYIVRAELRQRLVRPEQRGTGCSDRQKTFQTVTLRLGDL